MKGKLLITGVTALSLAALFGCQQQPAAPANTTTSSETKTSTAVLQINPSTSQSDSSANLTILSQETK